MSEQERKPEIPTSLPDVAFFHGTEPSGIPKQPSQLHSTAHSHRHQGKLPEVTVTGPGNLGILRATRETPRDIPFNTS